MITIKENPVTFSFIASLILAVILLSLQLPFMYNSDDTIFHVAKILAAKDGDFYTDPITGWQSIYPPLYHTVMGTIAAIFDLTGFQTSRLIQIAQFTGFFLAVFYLLVTVLESRRKASWGCLFLVLLYYAPTGKYWLLQNPSNFSLMFIITGLSLLLKYFKSEKLFSGLMGAVIIGIGVDLWWYNIIPVIGFFTGLIIVTIKNKQFRLRIFQIFSIGIIFCVTLCYNLWFLYQIREILPYYNYDMYKYSFAGQNGILSAILNWLSWFFLKGNQQFFKYLYPAALSSSNQLVIVYGFLASVYFYLLVLPFNFLLLYYSVKETITSYWAKGIDLLKVLYIASLITMLLSMLTLFRAGPAVLRRVQFYCFLFMLPAFISFLDRKILLKASKLLKWSLIFGCSLLLIYNIVYRFNIQLLAPLSNDTKEVITFIHTIDDYKKKRFFVTEYDNHILARESRMTSFLLRGNPIYFQLDKHHADSIENAYNTIINDPVEAQFWLREFNTEYAIIGKLSVNISPIMTKRAENELGLKMYSYFTDKGNIVFENDEWVVIKLEYPFKLN